MVKVIYEEVSKCSDCLYNKNKYCYNVGRPLEDLSKEDCPLPNLSDVEGFTKYITTDYSLKCCGNCKYWKRWGYNKHLNIELGLCKAEGSDVLSTRSCDSACLLFDGDVGESKFVRKCDEKVKMKYVIKTFLSCNRGKRFSAKEICEFIVGNGLNSRNSELNRSAIAHLIKSDVYILSDVRMERVNGSGRLLYWVE